MGSKIDVKSGDKYNYLTIVKEAEPIGKYRTFICKCVCGKEIISKLSYLRTEHTKSCGCYRSSYRMIENTTHGLSKLKLYKVWGGIKQRCLKKTASHYSYYGGRGITICQEWKNDAKAFYDWAIANGYKEGLEIDRINNNGNYEPDNCRWVNRTENNSNTSRNVYITVLDNTFVLQKWANILGISRWVLRNIIKSGKDINKYIEDRLEGVSLNVN